jgi:hypothetical protein
MANILRTVRLAAVPGLFPLFLNCAETGQSKRFNPYFRQPEFDFSGVGKKGSQ